MWAEARKQEKKIRGIMVDHKKRAERRREYYEKIVSKLFFYTFSVIPGENHEYIHLLYVIVLCLLFVTIIE